MSLVFDVIGVDVLGVWMFLVFGCSGVARNIKIAWSSVRGEQADPEAGRGCSGLLWGGSACE